MATSKLPLSEPPSSPFSVSCSSFWKGVTFLSAEGWGPKAEAGNRGPVYVGCSSRAVELMCSSFWKVLWSFGDPLPEGRTRSERWGTEAERGSVCPEDAQKTVGWALAGPRPSLQAAGPGHSSTDGVTDTPPHRRGTLPLT